MTGHDEDWCPHLDQLQEQEERISQLEAALRQAHPMVTYVSTWRDYVGVRPYAQAKARVVEAVIAEVLNKPTAEVARHSCFWHGPEPDMDGDYKSCFECGHVWRTEEEFARDVTWVSYQMRSPIGMTIIPALNQVSCCPLCTHDF